MNRTAASMFIILFSGYARRHDLTATSMFIGCGVWTIALIMTTLYYRVWPADAAHLRTVLQQRGWQLVVQEPCAIHHE